MPDKQQLAVGLDAGSARVRCVIGALEDGYVRFLGAGEAESAGWHRGRVVDSEALSAAVLRAIGVAEVRAQTLADAVVVGLGGSSVASGQTRAIYEVGRPRQIEAEDLSYAVRLAAQVQLENDRCVLQVLPQFFTIDGRTGIRRLSRGIKGSRVEAHAHVITASRQEHDTIVGAVNQAHVRVEETVFEASGASYAAILEGDRSRGVALLDIGMHSSELVIYDGEAIVFSATVLIGGDHFTRDTAAGFRITLNDAEMLKREHGCAKLGLTADSSIIEIPSSEGRPARESTRHELNFILESRAEDLFERVRKAIDMAGMQKQLLEGIVLCGGGSLLNGMEDVAETILDCPARKGLVIGIEDWPDELNRADWTTAAGLAMYSAKLKTRGDFRRKAPGFLNLFVR